MVVFLCKVKNKNMSEDLQRTQSLEPLHEVAVNLVQEMGGEQPEQRINWLMSQSGETFGRLLLDVNSAARGITPEVHSFDGEGVQAGMVDGSLPPDQEDKVTLLGELIQSSRVYIQGQLEQGTDAQTVMTELAVAIPTVVNKLHLFADGNGRTSRTLRMLLRDGDQVTSEKVDAVINKTGIEVYDTYPADPVEQAVMKAVRKENGTESYSVADDVIDDDFMEDSLSGDELDKLFEEQIPGVNLGIVKAYRDSFNFSETVRLIAKEKELGEKVSLKSVLEATTNPEELHTFMDAYRGVRKQRAELLIKGLLNEKELPLPDDPEGREVNLWINNTRKRNGLSMIEPNAIRTAQDFQMAYEETFSPQRAAA